MRKKLATERGRMTYRQRAQSVEPVLVKCTSVASMKFLLRGLVKAAMEWSLGCTTHNILKLWRATVAFA